MFDGWHKGERILLFSTNRLLDLLKSIKRWGCDGTFEVVPSPFLFDQLWIIYIRLAHTYIPAVFCLMNSRQQGDYQFILDTIMQLRTGIEPTSIAVDFEKAEWNAFQVVFTAIFTIFLNLNLTVRWECDEH